MGGRSFVTDRRVVDSGSVLSDVSDLGIAFSLLYWLLVAAAVVGVRRLFVGRAGDGSEPADSGETGTHSNS